MANAVKFTLAGSSVYFSDEEVRLVAVRQSQDTDLINNQLGAPYLHASGSRWDTMTMQIAETARDTKSRIRQIIDEQKEMTVYYNFIYDATASLKVFLVPDNIRTRYTFGEKAYGVVHTLMFMETSLP
ncbi:MAG: hypothetical protein PHX83_12025 [Acidobacteriia bacterium]|nr:hypothetical protein [Terriglobia bacterium]